MMLDRMAMMVMTTISSINENPERRLRGRLGCMKKQQRLDESYEPTAKKAMTLSIQTSF
jgi:AMMECR1 domain-containing protein